ncbi:MAG: hypothetical protein LIP23_08340 [Planctomycetes bacterium]|nr:hypothetical protein [Planctomycetota bacterium]
MRSLSPYLLAVFVIVAGIAGVLAGETQSGQAQPYEKVRYPTFANGRLQSMLEADQAEAYDLTEDAPRVNLRNVVITVFDHSDESLANTPEDQPLPAKMVITSDRGILTRRLPELGQKAEEVANLEGNVVMRQMRIGDSPPPRLGRQRRLDPSIETEIHCQHAQWNNTLRKLNGDGEVEFIQEDSKIVGTGFLYLADDDAMESGSSSSNIKNWGGIVFIEHNAVMEIDRELRTGGYDRTVITCKDTASYKLREREIQFEREVRVRRADLLIESDILKVFLRREGDPEPDQDLSAADNATNAPVPGMVKNIVATIGTRPGSVVITGYEIDPDGRQIQKYIAKGGRADMDYDSNRITLTDTRLERRPEVEFDQGRFTDRNLDFVFARTTLEDGGTGETVLEVLNASGGVGQVFLRPRQEGMATSQPTEITYKQDMVYSREDGRIRFRGQVFLQQGDLRIRAETIDARLTPELGSDVPNQLERIIAEQDVSLRSGDREASAQRAEYDILYNREHGQYLDTLKLFGPPQRTPPHPWIRDEYGNHVTGPIIVMQRLQSGPNSKPRHLLVASGGVAVCDFYTAPDNLVDKGKIISIKCENGMEYNESTQIATFIGQVQAASDDPEDNYVLTSDRLEIRFVERPNPDSPDDTVILLRRVNASGNARLMQDTRICEAGQIIRDFPTERVEEGDIYLEGVPAQAGSPARPAVYREQNGSQIGSMFTAPRIMSSANGDMIRANGPGQLSMPDELPGFRAEIHFDGAALYESYQDGMASEAKFRQAVVLRQPSRNLVIMSEELDARFQNDPFASSAPEVEGARQVNIERIGRLIRAEGRIDVRLEQAMQRQGRRIATGDRGVVEFTDTGNVVTLTANRQADNRRWVIVRDHDGMTLRAPEVEVRDQQGVTRASGPGELFIPGDRSLTNLAGRAATRIIYGERGRMVYNEVNLNIRISDNVRVIQPGMYDNWAFPSLDGRCNDMEITLLEPPAQDMSEEETMARVRRMDATGAVILRVYADPPPENPNIDWLNRPGTTFFTRGDQAVYDVADGRIVISSQVGSQPQLLLNMVDPGSPPRRQRLRADRFILNTNTVPRRWFFEGQLESNTLRDGEAFDFTYP